MARLEQVHIIWSMNLWLTHEGYDLMPGSDSLGWQRLVRPVSCDVNTNICTYQRPPELPNQT